MLTLGALAISAGIFVAGMTSGATGQAFPLIAGPIFLSAYPAPEAVALTAICSLTGQAFSTAMLRRIVAYEFRRLLIGAGLLGVPLGTLLLTHCNPHAVRIVLGLLISLSSLWGLLRPLVPGPTAGSRAAEALVGLCGGLTGGLVGAASVVPVIWCAARGLSKENQRAVTQPYIMAVQLASLLALGAHGVLNARLAGDYVQTLIPLLAGTGFGVAGFHLMSSGIATRVVLSIVAASGLFLLFA